MPASTQRDEDLPDTPLPGAGLNQRLIHRIFELAQRRSAARTYEVQVSMLEIYNEELRDLLAPSDQPAVRLEIRNLGQKHGVQVAGLHTVTVNNTRELLAIFKRGSANR